MSRMAQQRGASGKIKNLRGGSSHIQLGRGRSVLVASLDPVELLIDLAVALGYFAGGTRERVGLVPAYRIILALVLLDGQSH